jgi:hypothetical protein
MTCGPVQGKQMRIVGYHEHFIGEDSHAAVGAQGCVSN